MSSQFIKKPDSYSYAIISKAERSTWPKQLEDPRKLQLRLELLPFLPLMPRMRGLFERQIDLIGYPVGRTNSSERTKRESAVVGENGESSGASNHKGICLNGDGYIDWIQRDKNCV